MFFTFSLFSHISLVPLIKIASHLSPSLSSLILWLLFYEDCDQFHRTSASCVHWAAAKKKENPQTKTHKRWTHLLCEKNKKKKDEKKRFHTVITGCRIEPFLCSVCFVSLFVVLFHEEYGKRIQRERMRPILRPFIAGIPFDRCSHLDQPAPDLSIFNRETKENRRSFEFQFLFLHLMCVFFFLFSILFYQ